MPLATFYSEIILPPVLKVAKERFYNNNLLIKLNQHGLANIQSYIRWSLTAHVILEDDVRDAYDAILEAQTVDEAASVISFLLLIS